MNLKTGNSRYKRADVNFLTEYLLPGCVENMNVGVEINLHFITKVRKLEDLFSHAKVYKKTNAPYFRKGQRYNPLTSPRHGERRPKSRRKALYSRVECVKGRM